MSSTDPYEWQTSESAYSRPQEYGETMSSLQQIEQPAGDPLGQATELPSSSSRSPLMNFGRGLFDALGSSKKPNRDGQTPKKRGPKRDSKPALTRRQELNRQAQRTHRERKEGYIKSLEDQCMQLKEVYAEVAHEKQAMAAENQKLKNILRMNGIQYDSSDQSAAAGFAPEPTTTSASSRSASAYGFGTQSQQRLSSSHLGSMPHSSSFGSNDFYGDQAMLSPSSNLSPHNVGSSAMGSQAGLQSFQQQQQTRQQQQEALPGAPQAQTPLINYDQLGVDFVLDLEAACMDHLQFMCVRSNQDAERPPNGHALMMSCPPYSHIEAHPEVPYPHKAMDLPSGELLRLFQLSQNLPLDGEITPVIALNMILNHPRFNELSVEDFKAIQADLKVKTRCYGFGAVLEEFELRDAMNAILATKFDPSVMNG